MFSGSHYVLLAINKTSYLIVTRGFSAPCSARRLTILGICKCDLVIFLEAILINKCSVAGVILKRVYFCDVKINSLYFMRQPNSNRAIAFVV